jgi:hypothetical protein
VVPRPRGEDNPTETKQLQLSRKRRARSNRNAPRDHHGFAGDFPRVSRRTQPLETPEFAAGNLGVVVSNDLPTNGSRFLIIDNGRKIDVQIGVPLAEPAVHGGKVV